MVQVSGKLLTGDLKSLPVFFALRGWVGSFIAGVRPFLGGLITCLACRGTIKKPKSIDFCKYIPDIVIYCIGSQEGNIFILKRRFLVVHRLIIDVFNDVWDLFISIRKRTISDLPVEFLGERITRVDPL